MPFTYFAYGSNMFTPKMRDAAPSAKFKGIGRLSGYVLRFNKISDDGSGKGNIVATDNAEDHVLGVIFELDDQDRAALDRSEGGYDAVEIEVLIRSGPLSVLTYVAKPARVNNALRPYTCYKKFVVRGARKHELPLPYIEQLEAVEASTDPDAARERKNRALLSQDQTGSD